MVNRCGYAFAVLACLVPTVASSAPVALGRDGNEVVFVWKDQSSYSEAIKIIGSGLHKSAPQLVFSLMSCVVEKGTHAIVIGSRWASNEVLIVEGKNVGCRGVVAAEDVP
jgi:hypothetical protein